MGTGVGSMARWYGDNPVHLLQEVDNVFHLQWSKNIKYGDLHHETEVEFSKFNFDIADIDMHFTLFDLYEKESERLLKKGLALPAYDFCLKCSHTFNILDARGALSVTERSTYISKIRALAKECAKEYLQLRESIGFPLLKGKDQK
jgi:glycyl-tRNA synthetase alpha chain